MAIQLSLVKRHSLKGIGEGWTDECYIRVEASTPADVKSWEPADGNPDNAKSVRDVVVEKVLGGAVLSTEEDGTTKVKTFGKDDVVQVIDSLPSAILNEIFNTSLGFPQPDLTK